MEKVNPHEECYTRAVTMVTTIVDGFVAATMAAAQAVRDGEQVEWSNGDVATLLENMAGYAMTSFREIEL